MSGKIRNMTVLRCLEHMARVADTAPLSPYVNETVRGFYLKIVTPVLRIFLFDRKSNALLRLVPRHSVVERGVFNVFLSDVDYTLVIASSASEFAVSRLIERYQRLTRYFWFLGEIEVYSEKEQTVLEEIRRCDSFTINFVWRLRKLRWQQKAHAAAASSYHRFKAERAIRRLLVQLGLDAAIDPMAIGAPHIAHAVNQASTYWSPEDVKAPPLEGFSNYIEWPLEKVSAGFVAILPHGEEIADGVRDEVRRLRQNPRIAERLSRLALVELLLCRSARRLVPGRETHAWESYLQDLIMRYSTPNLLETIRPILDRKA